MFLERRTSVKMDLSAFNIRVNVKVIEFPLRIGAWFKKALWF